MMRVLIADDHEIMRVCFIQISLPPSSQEGKLELWTDEMFFSHHGLSLPQMSASLKSLLRNAFYDP
jgi:hypothetical protein